MPAARLYEARHLEDQAMSAAEQTVLPDRLSNDPDSPFYVADLIENGVGIKFNGQEKTNVTEYCISEGWIRVSAGKTLDRKGKPMTLMLKGKVEPYVPSKA